MHSLAIDRVTAAQSCRSFLCRYPYLANAVSITSVSAGYAHTCVLLDDTNGNGVVRCWGEVRLFAGVLTHSHLLTLTHTRTQTDTDTHAHTQAHSRTRTDTHTHAQAAVPVSLSHVHTHTHTRTLSHTLHAHSQSHTHSRTRTTHTHAHTHYLSLSNTRAHNPHTHARARLQDGSNGPGTVSYYNPGDDVTTTDNTPVNFANAVAVSAGAYATCALLPDSSLSCA